MTNTVTVHHSHTQFRRLGGIVTDRNGPYRWNLKASTSRTATGGDRPRNDPGNVDRKAPPNDESLMYVLGVNLARQLGDIRPLLVSPSDDTDTDDDNDDDDDAKNNSKEQYAKELSQVTAGIVDTIIGRVNEEQQIALLQQHGNALNALIQERA